MSKKRVYGGLRAKMKVARAVVQEKHARDVKPPPNYAVQHSAVSGAPRFARASGGGMPSQRNRIRLAEVKGYHDGK